MHGNSYNTSKLLLLLLSLLYLLHHVHHTRIPRLPYCRTHRKRVGALLPRHAAGEGAELETPLGQRALQPVQGGVELGEHEAFRRGVLSNESGGGGGQTPEITTGVTLGGGGGGGGKRRALRTNQTDTKHSWTDPDLAGTAASALVLFGVRASARMCGDD